MSLPDADRLAGLQLLTQEYSRYSRSAGGWSAIAGGCICLLSYLLGATLAASPALMLTFLALPILWLALKQAAAQRYQARHGLVQELSATEETRTRAGLLIGISLIVAIIAVGLVLENQPFGTAPWSLAKALHLAIILAAPILAWRYLPTPLDLVVGAFLLCQASLAVLGVAYPLWSTGLVFVPAAILMIAVGLREHQRFRGIDQRLGALGIGTDQDR